MCSFRILTTAFRFSDVSQCSFFTAVGEAEVTLAKHIRFDASLAPFGQHHSRITFAFVRAVEVDAFTELTHTLSAFTLVPI
jgi:hypothetical protein